LAVALVGFLVLQWWTTRENDKGLRQIRDAVQGAAPMIPRTDAEYRWFAGVSLTAGICEEILYRGFLFAWVTALLGPWAGLALTTLAFGSAHLYQGPSGMVRTSVAGLVFGGLVLVGGSLWPAVLVHIVLDLTSGSLARRALARGPEPVAAPA
jgi:membrane protease YdiL (CAAX protease family)